MSPLSFFMVIFAVKKSDFRNENNDFVIENSQFFQRKIGARRQRRLGRPNRFQRRRWGRGCRLGRGWRSGDLGRPAAAARVGWGQRVRRYQVQPRAARQRKRVSGDFRRGGSCAACVVKVEVRLKSRHNITDAAPPELLHESRSMRVFKVLVGTKTLPKKAKKLNISV